MRFCFEVAFPPAMVPFVTRTVLALQALLAPLETGFWLGLAAWPWGEELQEGVPSFSSRWGGNGWGYSGQDDL